MQQTVIALSQEVEYLSRRNQQMLNDLKKKDPFYETYVKVSDELTKLRQAHTILISMVQNKHINLKQTKDKEISSQILPSGLTANQPDG
jgi:hypothetical protein